MKIRPSHEQHYSLKDVDAPVAEAFLAMAKRNNLSEKRIGEGLAWWRDYGSKLDSQDARLESFLPFARSKGWSDDEADAALNFHTVINDPEHGLESIPLDAPPSATEIEKQLAEIGATRRNDPDLYDRSPDLQFKELDLIALREAAAPQARPIDANPSAGRLAEIREYRKANPESYDNKADPINGEELSLIAANIPTAPEQES